MSSSSLRRTLRVISDLHLEFGHGSALGNWLSGLAPADALVLAGDVCTSSTLPAFASLIRQIGSQYSRMFYVLGNHEYYGVAAFDDVLPTFRTFTQAHGVTLLENETVQWSDGLEIVGTTLWSDVTPRAYSALADSRFLTRGQFLQKHNDAVAFMHALPVTENKRIVVTHHLPSTTLTDVRYAGSPYNSGFASDTVDLARVNANVWIYGHTHIPRRTRIGETDFICNPQGYPDENKGEFSDYVIEV